MAEGRELPEGSSLYDFHQKVSRAFHAQRACVRPVAMRLGLGDGQPRILSFVATRGTATQSDIARFFGIDPAAVSRMLGILRKNGFVTVTCRPDNRRANEVVLTESGHEAIRVWDRCCAQVVDDMLDGFTPEERAAFGAFLDRAFSNLDAARRERAQASIDGASGKERVRAAADGATDAGEGPSHA